MKLKWSRQVPRHPIGQIATVEGQRLGIIDLGTDLSRDLRKEMNYNILTHGEPFGSGGILGPACLPVVGASSAIASSLFAGNLFLATANPATLMTVGGGGVLSAVVGAGGKIVAQAPFIAAGSAIIPVVAPVMFFMVLSSMMMSVRFDQIQTSLVQLAQAVELLIKREITGDYGILMSALERIEDISEELSESRRFTEEMRIRMAIVERDVNVLHHKYNILSREPVNLLSARLKAAEIDLFVTSSLADIQVDGLRLKLALQDNPDDVPRSFSTLNAKIDRYEEHFRQLLEHDSVKRYQAEMQESVDSMGWWKRNVLLRKQRKKKEADIKDIQSVRDDKLELVRMSLARWSDNLALGEDTAPSQSVVYYREHGGKGDLRAYYTSDWQLLPKNAGLV